MNGARIRVVRQDLGLTVDTAAAVLGVETTTMRRWETARSKMPPGAVEDLLALVERSRALARAYAAELAGQAEPWLVTYASDEALWAAQPDLAPLPAAWHRAVVARVIDQVPGVEVVYPGGARRPPDRAAQAVDGDGGGS